jgi:hypothetical protein|tara:strand:+ start:589 stop:1041 length:453 start_codon:yes stop_codon:yes gene_type:complete
MKINTEIPQELQDQISEFRNTGAGSWEHIVTQLAQLYTMINIGLVNYEIYVVSKNILNLMEDIIIPNILGTHPNAWKDLAEVFVEINEQLKKEYAKNLHLKDPFRLYKINSQSYTDDQQRIIAIEKQKQRLKFRKLNQFARLMRVENKDL